MGINLRSGGILAPQAGYRLSADLELTGYFGLGPALGDSVGLIEDRGGSDLNNHRIGTWFNGVVAQLLCLAIDKDSHNAARN